VRRGDVQAVHSLRRGAAEALEGVVRGDRRHSKLAGRRVEEVPLPAGAHIGALVRGLHGDDGSDVDRSQAQPQVIMPHHDTVIQANDHVIVFIPRRRSVREVEKLFQPAATFFG
jgi:trk system potassium uptake protein TrkA